MVESPLALPWGSPSARRVAACLSCVVGVGVAGQQKRVGSTTCQLLPETTEESVNERTTRLSYRLEEEVILLNVVALDPRR